jgi:hypothetical protein
MDGATSSLGVLSVLALLIAVFFALLLSDEPPGAAKQMVRTLLK